ncbi:hypothetical protein K432DRAFT_151643 [Lepidopterella palustris CBS 459.81]|uniref:Uncharacterized protein n=1 Tax=Lepidopterella palustris CBS 459.81 TaxID=1314670 RepID=A0A8E2E2K8_9PEZI|nr:hypothetical protein K432DRAFT_151643 [Lepidopterella palustris CBS 459.81]
MSIRTSAKIGRISYSTPPAFTMQALGVITSSPRSDLSADFIEKFGDYYVAALILGGDSAVLLSSAAENHAEAEHLVANLEGHFLGMGASETIDKLRSTGGQSRSISLNAFDSLDASHAAQSASDSMTFDDLKRKATQYMSKALELGDRVNKVAQRQGIFETKSLSISQCDAICEAGLVAEVMLLPFTGLRDFVIVPRSSPLS